MSRTAVTGAGGFIGAYLTRRLLADGHEVVAIDNYVRGRRSRLDDLTGELQLAEVDVRDEDTLKDHLQGVDAVFHLAAVNGTENFYNHPELVLDVGVRGILAVVGACISAGVPDLVVASSAEVYQTPPVVPTPEDVVMVVPDALNPRYSYGGSKIVSELVAFNYGRGKLAKVQVFRPHNVYGPDMGWKHVIPQLLGKVQAAGTGGEGAVELQGDGSETRAFCFVEDIVSGIVTMWEQGETMSAYNIGSMEEVAIRDLAAKIADAAGVDVTFTPGPAAQGGTPRRCPDTTKLQRLGFEARVGLDEGLKRTAAWYLENPEPIGGNRLL